MSFFAAFVIACVSTLSGFGAGFLMSLVFDVNTKNRALCAIIVGQVVLVVTLALLHSLGTGTL